MMSRLAVPRLIPISPPKQLAAAVQLDADSMRKTKSREEHSACTIARLGRVTVALDASGKEVHEQATSIVDWLPVQIPQLNMEPDRGSL